MYFVVLETNWLGIGGLVTAVGGVIGLLFSQWNITRGMRTTAQVAVSAANITADTNSKISDPKTGTVATHALVNSNMTKMFWALGIACSFITGLVTLIILLLRSESRGTPK